MSRSSLAVFVGQSFRKDAEGYWTDESFIKFIEAFVEVYGTVTLLVRVHPDAGAGCYRIDSKRFRVVPLPFFDQFRPLHFIKAIKRIRRELTEELPRHGAVWVGGPHLLGSEVVRLCRALGVPCFLTIRQDLRSVVRCKARGLQKPLASVVAAMVERRFAAFARQFPTFTVGRSTYLDYGGDRLPNVHEIYVNLLRDAQIPREVPQRTAGSPFRLLWVGRFSPEKGLPVLLHALATISSRPDAPVLDLVGTGEMRDELQALSTALGVAGRVEFKGYVPFGPQLAESYRRADLFVLPSHTEGLPQVLLEAMAAGVPCLASSVGGIPDFVQDGEDAFLVPPGDPEALRSRIVELMSNTELRARAARSGLEKVRRHTLEKERAKMVDVLDRQLGFRSSVATG